MHSRNLDDAEPPYAYARMKHHATAKAGARFDCTAFTACFSVRSHVGFVLNGLHSSNPRAHTRVPTVLRRVTSALAATPVTLNLWHQTVNPTTL